MFVTGTILHDDIFSQIYSIFSNKNDLQNWKEKIIEYSIKLETKEYKNLSFPLIIIEQNNGKDIWYEIILKNDFKNIVENINRKNNHEEIYFNLWRIDKNCYNEFAFNEPCLNGRIEHLHFTEYELLELNSKGIDIFWENILKSIYR